MTQSSVAVAADPDHWVILNASPDIRAQIGATPALHPRGLRASPIRAVILTNGDVDHVAGLLTLREKAPLTIHATEAMLDMLRQPVFGVLDPDLVARAPIALDTPFQPVPGLTVTAFAVPGKVPLFLEDGPMQDDDPDLALVGEQTIALRIATADRVVAYVPNCAAVPADLPDRLQDADLVFFDGTVWQDDEMRRTGTGTKTGGRMGHLPMSGPGGSLARLAGVTAPRRLFIHINNTNPVLQPDSPERAALDAAGWGLAHDGMELSL